jgi:lipopolysaccharide biosynthesis protein
MEIKENNASTKSPQVIAFYLPQFHPIPENDLWWGKGFTEWTNVGKARPLFKGHYQPRVPADLGYYDLRIPEVRKQQAELAKEAGISAFCYWHYWFGNHKRIMEMPLQEVIKTGEPDFPFCLGWANHSWYRKSWNADAQSLEEKILIEQTYPGEQDIKDHFYAMLDAFKDDRYYKTDDGRLLFLIYSCEDLPDINKFIDIWQSLAEQNGLPHFFFVGYAANTTVLQEECLKKCDAVTLSSVGMLSQPSNFMTRLKRKVSIMLKYPVNIMSYEDAVKKWDKVNEFSEERIYPCVFPNWDHSARLGAGGFILHNSTPLLFKKHMKSILKIVSKKKKENQIVFIKSWNEWAEGNYMEPDLKYGKGYILALYDSLNETR